MVKKIHIINAMSNEISKFNYFTEDRRGDINVHHSQLRCYVSKKKNEHE